MFEIILFSVIVFLFAAGLFSPFGKYLGFSSAYSGKSKAAVATIRNTRPEHRNFLAYLESEIEAELFPRPTDSVLRRHYDAMVAQEVQYRLALMAE